MTTTRTYETFDIAWADGSRWTNFDEEHATHLAASDTRTGRVVRRTYKVEIPDALLAHANPGIEDA